MKYRHHLKHILFFFLVFSTINSLAWIYPEHRDIALLAIQKLDPETRAILDRLWSDARMGYESRLTESVIDSAQKLKPSQLDYASWTAISGDHSCSSSNLLHNVLETEWILKVADIAAKLKLDLSEAKRRDQQINAIRNSDIRFQRADPEYASRAGSNNAHFLLARPKVNTNKKEYLISCVSKGTELNAVGNYSWFHTSALLKARIYATENLTAAEKSKVILAALADEAFALHFLEDIYAAGHTAGTWGNASMRKGTHDFYNENGLEVVTWDGKRMILMGDAYMKPENAELVSHIIVLSLNQFINTASGKIVPEFPVQKDSSVFLPDSFNVCMNNINLELKLDTNLLGEILEKTPVPALATGKGELPRFRAELGPFLGVSSSLNLYSSLGGFGTKQTNTGLVSGIEANFRMGLGLDGVLNEAGDGLVFLQFGWRQDANSTNEFTNNDIAVPAGAITAAIPGRSAYNFRIRMPFWLIPGDLIIAAPILLIASPKLFEKMAVTAGNGGVIPWQSGIATRVGRFQFVLGREVGISFYGTRKPSDVILIPTSTTSAYFIEYKSTQFDFPIIEYRPFRAFSMNQSSSLVFQLSGGFDSPEITNIIIPEGSDPAELKTVWHLGLRIAFDWRKYLK